MVKGSNNNVPETFSSKKNKSVTKTSTSKKPEVVGWSIKDNTTGSSVEVLDKVLRIFDAHIETLDKYDLYKILRQQYTRVSLKIIEHRNGRVLEIYSEYLTRLWFRISINLDTKKISMNYGEKQSSYLANNSSIENNGTHTSFWLILVGELTEENDFTKVDNAYDAYN
jgi:hypothetical protein